MNIKRAKQEIKDTIAAYLTKDEFGEYAILPVRQRPVLLIGPPGVGKTQIMEQISQECGIGLVAYTITHHTRQSAIGLPFIERKKFGGQEYAVTEYTMSEIVASIYNKMEKTGLKEGILFIDEINCVSETLAPTMLQFLQGKSFGNHRIPEGWVIVAAGNPPEYNKSVREFDVVTLDRIRRMEIEPDYGVWKEYAARAGIHPALRAYLDGRQQYFCRIETTVDGRLFATPRGWEDLSELVTVYERLGQETDREVVMEYIQFPKIAKDFANYLELYHKYQDDYQVPEILAGAVPEGAVEKLERAPFDERISVVSLLLSGLNGYFREVCQTAEMMELRLKKLQEFRQSEAFAADRKREPAFVLDRFGNMLEEFRQEQEHRKESGLMSRLEQKKYCTVMNCMEQDLQTLRKETLLDGDEVWDRLRELFAVDSDRYEDMEKRAGEALEHAFDFMEAAFANGHEMVLFVTELNTGFYSVQFLQEYECERYYQYNENLLFAKEEQGLREALSGRQSVKES